MFWEWVQRSARPVKTGLEHLRDLTSLGLTAIPAQVLADDALDIALKHRVTAYDAYYIAAAAKLGLPLMTADEKLVRQVKKIEHDVRLLGRWRLLQHGRATVPA